MLLLIIWVVVKIAVVEDLTEEECYLWAILSDPSGLDIAEFAWFSAEERDGCFRAWPFQWRWWRNVTQQQIDQCFPGDTLITTRRGQVPISEVVLGDEVLTHENRWRSVTYLWDRGEQETIVLKGHGHSGLEVTPDHSFYLQNEEWRSPEVGDCWASPSEFPSSDIPALPERTYAPGRPDNIPNDVTSLTFMWLYGLFLAEGSISSSFGKNGTLNRVTYSVHSNEVAEVESKLREVGLRFNTHRVASEECFNIVINSRPLATWLYEHGGKGAKNKHLASWVLGLQESSRSAVLAGAMFGDGYKKRGEYVTVSKALALGIKLLGQSLGFSATLRSVGGRISEINGRQIIGGQQFVVGLCRTGKAINDGNHYWAEIKSLAAGRFVRCYDIEVEEDHSFVADGIVVSNCARSVGKSLSIQVRAFAFPFIHPGQEMVITAPEGNHLDAITDNVETRFINTRLGAEMLVQGRSGVKHRPFHMNFANGSRIMGRIPQRDGKGVKGIHPIWLELDEAQDYPDSGWTEIIETLKQGSLGAVWRAHGVTRGMRDFFYKFTQPDSGWHIHRLCLPSSALVYGETGPVRIEDIEEGTSVFGCAPGPALQVSEVTGKTDNGAQPTWKITTRDREITSTFNHPVLAVTNNQTRKTRRKLEFEWREASDVEPGDFIVVFTKAPTSDRVASDLQLCEGMEVHSPDRCVPSWIWTASDEAKHAFLNGYLIADGSLARQKRGQDALAISCASESLVRELVVLAQYLGYRTTKVRSHASSTPLGESRVMWRAYVYQHAADFVQVPRDCSVHDPELDEHLAIRKVLTSEATGISEQTWDIEVEGLHNFVADGVVVHNTAMHRPTWSDEERQSKIQSYGSRDHPDYRRNVLGLHGDATNPLFVLHRLMQCVDSDNESNYNLNEYTFIKINNEMVLEQGDDILPLLDFPQSHMKYKNFWIGMDVGYTNHPSELVVFGETKERAKDSESGVKRIPANRKTALKLLSRIRLERISHGHQVNTILWLVNFYKPRAFAMDKTGLGLPLFQDIQERASIHPEYRIAVDTLKGYNFSGKILVDFDSSVEVDEYRGDIIHDSGIQRNVLEYSSDRLRAFVDEERIILPNHTDMIREFQGQTWVYDKSTMDMYGRKKVYSKGSFHVLDATRMAVLGFAQNAIEEMTKVEKHEPVPAIFLY